jgi:hypothetical protein
MSEQDLQPLPQASTFALGKGFVQIGHFQKLMKIFVSFENLGHRFFLMTPTAEA